MPFKSVLLRFLPALLVIVTDNGVFAQLKADFTIDKTGGCSPLSVQFTNTTTNASGAATCKWDLGNGNTSALLNAAATYTTEKTYSVTLTVTDGTKTSVQTKQVIVFKPPVVDFNASPVKGCLPLPVTLASNSTAGDGTIANYFWDFGDGNTQEGITFEQVSHTYSFVQNATVSLTVTNSNGCYTTIKKPAAQVLQAIQANFVADHTTVCNISDPINFTNTSTGPGTLNYSWDFGDGITSTDKNPSHVYGRKGLYTVKMTVSNKDGCSNTVVQSGYINVSNYTVDFAPSAVICRDAPITFTDNSTPGGTNEVMIIDGVSLAYYPGFVYSFPSAGNHTVQLTATYGVCSISSAVKMINVNELPVPAPFIMNILPYCKTPATVSFKDTTHGAVAWLWKFDVPYGSSASNVQAPSFGYDPQGTYYISLTVTNAAGCSAAETQSVNIVNTDASVYLVSSENLNGCGAITTTFAAAPYAQIAGYQWDFGDGAKSTDPQPTHIFTQPGTYIIKLNYTLLNGCKGSTDYSSVTVYKKPVADFTTSANVICGNGLVSLTDKSIGPVTNWNWNFGTTNYTTAIGGETAQNPQIKYTDSGTFDIQLIAYNGSCSDTMKKSAYIKALPAFPVISGSYNTCDGTRGLVNFTEASKYAVNWKWDFGDGSSQSFTTRQDTVQHSYTKTGHYSVVLTTVNGQCTDTAMINVYVLLKQNPLLTSTKTTICTNELMPILVSNYDFNPNPNFSGVADADYYQVTKWQYGDSSTYMSQLNRVDSMGFRTPWYNSLKGTLGNLSTAETKIRLISMSEYFGCSDTSNYLPIKINGPIAGFKITSNNVCYNDPIIFQDTSKGTGNVAIASWTWTYGDNTSFTRNQGGIFTHKYTSPGTFFPAITVTDAQGCSATSGSNAATAYVNGPGAAFSFSPAFVSPNTPISFFNNTNTAGALNVLYQWDFGDGTGSITPNPVHAFTSLGTDTVKLIARNPATGCTDTSIQVLHVKNVNAAFTYVTTYINNNSCPPFVAKFTNNATNAISVSWDFGDGSEADNQNNPSHTYNNSGVYVVTMYAYGNNGIVDSAMDSITVKGPYAILSADFLSGCLAQTITLSAQVKNATSFTWDFADGTVSQTRDTFAVHAYLTPGLYTPSLILKDAGGCSSTSSLGDTVVIDTLNVNIRKNTSHLCDSGWVHFSSQTVSLAADQLHRTLQYHWNFGTGIAADTSNLNSPAFDYIRPGKYAVTLTVSSPYGCVKSATDTVTVIKVSKASITGPIVACPGLSLQYNGNATASGNTTAWAWNFANGDLAYQQNATEIFADSGVYRIQLVLANEGCLDTAYQSVVIHSKPVLSISPAAPAICLGKSVQLIATGATGYNWAPGYGLDNVLSSSPLATPAKSITYTLTGANIFGCKSVDSVPVIVAGPFNLKVPSDTFSCIGSSVELYADGASSFQWINNTVGLSNTAINNPVASPATDAQYTVVGYDAYGCFTDTANIKVSVEPLPSVNAGPDIETMTGSSLQLSAEGSADIISWNWTPTDYLSCTDCASPMSEPRNNMNYIVTGKTKYGCAASDTVVIKLVCAQDRVYIPDAFTPNNDGKNDVFYIKGKGIKMIRSMRIFSRWGEKVFERSGINVDDRSAGWDGIYKGAPAPIGTYVYFAELVCDTGEVFPVKGSLLLIR